MEIIRGVERVARKNRVSVLVSEFELREPVGRTIGDTVERRPRCVLSVSQLSEAERAQLTAKGIPFVVFDPADELPDGVPFVGATNWRGGQAATRHLLDLGHRRIAMISGFLLPRPALRIRLRPRRGRPAHGTGPGDQDPAHPRARPRRRA
ncbi:hypothetical protein AB0M38_26900 [Streptomyces sp. NPDC051742]|uniref:hypothetical protein n=1 Tax=unclassified Streptomyces TaxID=2593676 RepID=UPI0034134FD1